VSAAIKTNFSFISIHESSVVAIEEKIKISNNSLLIKYINSDKIFDFIFGSVEKHWAILHGFRPYKIYYSWGFYTSHSTGFFIKRQSAKKIGFYDLKYKYSSDYDYFYRMIAKEKLKGVGTQKSEIFGVFRMVLPNLRL
jgi:hypothetical protein